jgi:pyruvate kinase
MNRCTKIVATIGPACGEEPVLSSLLEAGVNVARLNFSHGTHADHLELIQRLRQAAERLNRPLCILQDLQGPKIRTGELVAEEVKLRPGRPLTLTTRVVPGDENCVSVDFPELPQSVEPGGRILLDDGALELKVLEIVDSDVKTRVITGGVLKSHKGINLPGGKIAISALTEKDRLDLAFGLQHGVDMVALSFVRSPQDILDLRQAMSECETVGTQPPVIAKLERPEALGNLLEIVHLADGVMVARGDLGVEMSPEVVPIAQKKIIEAANLHGRLVITATQMLESMMHNPRPTRAEASDVANAIFDGTDAVMLSGETAAGDYPLQSVQMMHAIIREAEDNMDRWGHWRGVCEPDSTSDDTYFLTRAARELAHDRNVAAIAVFTMSGRTALLTAKTRPGVPVLAFTPSSETYRRMAMYWGVTPYLVPQSDDIDTMLSHVDGVMAASKRLQPGQQVVLICGYPVGAIRPTNLALLHTVGERHK